MHMKRRSLWTLALVALCGLAFAAAGCGGGGNEGGGGRGFPPVLAIFGLLVVGSFGMVISILRGQ